MTRVLRCVAAFTVSASLTAGAAWAGNDLLAVTGDIQPGALGPALLGVSLGTLNSDGQVAFRATLQEGVGGVTSGNDEAIWTIGGAAQLVAREGTGGAPGGGEFSTFHFLSLDDAGGVATRATLASSQAGLWRMESTGSGSVVARTADFEVPGVVDGRFSSLPIFAPLLHAPAGALAWNGVMASGPGGVSGPNDAGVWRDHAGAAALIARERTTAAPGVAGGQFIGVSSSSVNSQGQVAAAGGLLTSAIFGITTSNNAGIWRLTPGGGNLVARRGAAAPGSTGVFQFFEDPVINASGQVAFNARLNLTGSVTETNKFGVWLHDGAALAMVARAEAGGVPGVTDAHFAQFQQPLLNDAGQLIFAATLATGVGGVTTDDDSGIWRFEEGASHLVAREGAEAPGLIGGGRFASFSELAFNAAGVAAVQAELATSGPGAVPAGTEQGLWLLDAAFGDALLVARAGDEINGRTIAALDFRGGSAGGDGRQRTLNDRGQVVYRAVFENGDEGLLRYTPALRWRNESDGPWSDASNWTLSLAPDVAHEITIAAESSLSVTGPTADTTVNALTIGGGGGLATLQLSPAATLSAIEGVDVVANGQLAGQGTLEGDVRNGGLVGPGVSAGVLAIDGDFIQSAVGGLSIQLGGSDNSDPHNPQYDQLTVEGSAELQGAITISLIDDFLPGVNDTLHILTAGLLSDDSSMDLPELPSGRSWQVTTTDTSLSLVVAGGDISADFDGNTFVDGADLLRWETNFGAASGADHSQGDADGDDDVDGADFLVWQRELTGPASMNVQVPEPAGLTVALALVAALPRRRRRGRAVGAPLP